MPAVRSPYEEHRGYVLGVLGRRCGWLDPADREALFHDAYAVFLEKQRDGQLDVGVMRPGQVRAYLTQTALNKAMDEGKRAGRRRSVSLDDEEFGFDPADPGRGPDDYLAARFDDARIREIVAELPERQQVVIKLRFFFDRSPQEIQGYLGVTERVYRRELERATRHVAERYELVRQGAFCDSRRSLILAFVAGVAGPTRAIEARRHLETCPGCATWAAELRTAVKRVAGFVPPPLLTLPLLHRHAHHLLRGARDRAIDLASRARGHAIRVVLRADPSTSAALSVARPSTVAAVVAGCLAAGSTATYCVVHGLPGPISALIRPDTPRPHHHRSLKRTAVVVAPRHRTAIGPTVTTAPPEPSRRLITPTSRPQRRRGIATPSTASAATARAQRVHRATSPEFGVAGTPVSPSTPSSSASATSHTAAVHNATTHMPEFGP